MAQIRNMCLTLMIVAIASVTATDYCNVESCKIKSKHTMCLYTSSKPSQNCGDLDSVGLSIAEKYAILKKHNQLRKKVASGEETRGINGPQPAAVYMPDLVWDKELEMIAQRWANQCYFGHDVCRNVERFEVGQNIAQVSRIGNLPTVEELIQKWYDEVDRFDPSKVRKFNTDENSYTGHYTQMMWAKTKLIGCGRVRYKLSAYETHYLVCNYGPSGNVKDEPMYEIRN